MNKIVTMQQLEKIFTALAVPVFTSAYELGSKIINTQGFTAIQNKICVELGTSKPISN